MIQDFITKIKIRVVLVFIIVHLGLIMGVYSLSRYTALSGWDQTAGLFLASLVCLYLGFFLAVFFIVWPALPWIKRAQSAQHWSQRIITELPALMEHLPKILAIVQAIRAAWNSPQASEKVTEK